MPEQTKAREIVEKTVSSSVDLSILNSKKPEFDHYLKISPNNSAANLKDTNTVTKVQSGRFANDKLQQLFIERRKKEQMVPVDARSELSRYLGDPIEDKDGCDDVLR